MPDSERLRQKVARLLALALTARDNGDPELAEQFVALALRYEDEAALRAQRNKQVGPNSAAPSPPRR